MRIDVWIFKQSVGRNIFFSSDKEDINESKEFPKAKQLLPLIRSEKKCLSKLTLSAKQINAFDFLIRGLVQMQV